MAERWIQQRNWNEKQDKDAAPASMDLLDGT
jgi:hypothetical protein